MTKIEERLLEDANQVLAIDRRMKQIDEEIAVLKTKISELEIKEKDILELEGLNG